MKKDPKLVVKKVFQHGVVWGILLYILNSSFLGLAWGPFNYEQNTLLIPTIYGMGINAMLFYLNAYWFIPKLLKRKKTFLFWSRSLLLIAAFSLVEMCIDWAYLAHTGALELILAKAKEKGTEEDLLTGVLVNIVSAVLFNIFYWAMAFLYRLPSDWIQNERIKNQLAQDKLSAELEFLRAQINPHFLFNGINSIYHLIGYDDKSAKDVLLKFSGLLRYQLYECNEEYISLYKELEYINNYIKLEEIRKGEDACFTIDLPQNEMSTYGSLKIAPLLFTPFLENAFKYLSLYSEKEKNKLSVNMSIANGVLVFVVENSINHEMVRKQEKDDGGIGLENVKRRLKLLYPEKHKISITSENEQFKVQLKLQLK